MGWLENILSNLVTAALGNIPIFFFITFIATALWGDFSLIFIAIFAVQANISLVLVFVSAFFGTLLGDSLWFLLGKKSAKKLKRIKRIEKHYQRISKFLERTFQDRHLLALTLVKFLYGTRVITIFYLADERMTYKTFIKYNIIATFFWVVGVGAIGWLAGIGLGFILDLFKNLRLGILLLLVFLLAINIIQKIINKKLEK